MIEGPEHGSGGQVGRLGASLGTDRWLMASFARFGVVSAQAFRAPIGGSASSDVGGGVRDYGSAAHCSAVTSGQRMAPSVREVVAWSDAESVC